MRRLLAIFAALICLTTSAQTKYYVGHVPVGQTGKVIDKNSFGGTLHAQDTLVVMDTDGYRHGYLALVYLYGTADGTLNGSMDTTKPIVVMAGGTDTTWIGSLSLTGCKNVKVTGRGKAGINYGFFGGETFAGIIVDGRSSWIEVEKYGVINALYIMQAKQDNRCPDSATAAGATPWGDSLNYAGGFHMDHIYAHNMYARNIYGDGYYFGNTAPTAGYATPCTFPVQGTVLFSSIPMRMSNVRIEYDTMYYIGRTAIQISGADTGHNSIAFNYVYGSGYEINNQQGANAIVGGCTDSINVHHNTFTSAYQENVILFGFGSPSRPQIVEDNAIDSAGVLPFTVYDKLQVTNTDTAYARVQCYYDNIDPAVTKIKIYRTKTSGTVNSYAYIMGIPFSGQAKIGDTATATGTYVACSDTVHFANTASENYQFTVTGNYQFYKVIIKQTGTQVNTYRCYVNNAQYNFGIGVDDKVTFPARKPVTFWLRRNTFGLSDSTRGGYDIVTGDYQLGATGYSAYTDSNRICTQLRTSGTAATLQNTGGVNYSTSCNGGIAVTVTTSGDQDITLPTSSAVVSGSATSVNGAITGYVWSLNSGPNTPTIVSPTSQTTSITGLVQGTYTFKLTATDVAAETGFKFLFITVHGQPGNNLYRRKVTIDYTKVDSVDLINFPMVFKETQTYFKTEANGGKVKNSNGYDIRVFSDSLCADKLNFELEKYVATTGEVVMWIQIDSLAGSSNTVFWIGYGDSTISTNNSTTNTWKTDYQAVYHLKDGTTLTAADATANAVNGTITSATATTGQLDGGASFSGASKIDLGNNLGLTSDLTYEAWIKVTDYSHYGFLFSKTNGNQPNPYDIYMTGTSGIINFFVGDGTGGNSNVASSAAPGTGAWHRISVVKSGTNVKHYLDGVLNGTGNFSSVTVTNGTTHSIIGTRGDTFDYFNGLMDEVNVLNTALTSHWIKTEYNNQSSPSTFYSIGAEQNMPGSSVPNRWHKPANSRVIIRHF